MAIKFISKFFPNLSKIKARVIKSIKFVFPKGASKII